MQTYEKRIVELRDHSTVDEGPTVFDVMLNPNLEKGQWTPSVQVMTEEALLLLLAGTDTTTNILITAVYNLLSHPDKLALLKTELRSAMPNKEEGLEWAALERIPYLVRTILSFLSIHMVFVSLTRLYQHAVIQESLRLGYGVPGRLPRVVPSTGAVFCGHSIPPGVSLSYTWNPKPLTDGIPLKRPYSTVAFTPPTPTLPSSPILTASLQNAGSLKISRKWKGIWSAFRGDHGIVWE